MQAKEQPVRTQDLSSANPSHSTRIQRMTTLTICKTVVCLIFLVHGRAACCDAAFVAGVSPLALSPVIARPTSTRLRNDPYNNPDNWWEGTGSAVPSYQQHHQVGEATPPVQPKASPPDDWWEGTGSASSYQQQQQQHQVVHEVPPPVQPKVNTQEQLELQIQELETQLVGRTPRQEINTEAFLTLFDVRDNLARALEAVPPKERETNDALRALCDGVILTEKGLDKVFEMSGLVKYGTVGEPFDHHIHHALCEYADPEKEPDTVGHIIKAGYLLQDNVLRCAEVAVVKREPRPDETCELGS